MYLLFDNTAEKQRLKGFKSTQNYICFAFENNVTEEPFANIENLTMYADDDVYLSEYTLANYKLVCNGNELYLKNGNEVIDLEVLKSDKITESKDKLAEWLESNPMLYTDGKYYSVTAERQSLLNGNLASYERAKSAGIEYPLKWNSTGDECAAWTYEALVTLSLTIAAYVAPKVSQQQEIELAIAACETIEALDKVVISYE